MAAKTPEEMRSDVCKLAYEESLKGLTLQDSTLTSIRHSAVAFGTLSGLIATFLGREVLRHNAHADCVDCACKISIVVALGALFLSLLLIAELLRPKPTWRFHSSARGIISQFADGETVVRLDKTYEILACFKEDDYQNNEIALSQMFPKLYALIVLLIVQITAWLIALFV